MNEPLICKNCGCAVSGLQFVQHSIRNTKVARKTLEGILANPGITYAGLTEFVYEDDEEGGPLAAVQVIRHAVGTLDKRLRLQGFSISRAGKPTTLTITLAT